MRRNIVAALEREPDFVVCGECDDVPEALVAIESLHPDVVLTDITLKSSNGLDLIRALRQRHPGVPSVATTMFDVHANERLALAAGACRFVSKHWGPDSLVRAVRAAMLETTKLSPAEG
jgi:DNA-binding NarL/FixJ family response regulator